MVILAESCHDVLGKEATMEGLGVGGSLLAKVAVSVATQSITLILALVL